jgi:cytochrome P450
VVEYKTNLNLVKGFKAWLGPLLFFIPFSPEDIKIILNSGDCQNKPSFLYKPVFTYGLISMNGNEYKAHRKAAVSLFTWKALQSFLPSINEVMNEFLINFDTKLQPKTFEPTKQILNFALNSTLSTIFGLKIDQKYREKFVHDAQE